MKDVVSVRTFPYWQGQQVTNYKSPRGGGSLLLLTSESSPGHKLHGHG